MKEQIVIPKEGLDKYYYEGFLSSEEIGKIYGKSKDWVKKYLWEKINFFKKQVQSPFLLLNKKFKRRYKSYG